MINAAHPIKRARERYNVDLDWRDIHDLAKQCLKKSNWLADRDKEIIAIVEHKGTPMKAVFSKQAGRIMTFLPLCAKLPGDRAKVRKNGKQRRRPGR